jgi:hypothetical protein
VADDIRAAFADHETWEECRRCGRVKRVPAVLGLLHHYVDWCRLCAEEVAMQTTGTFPALSQPRPPKKKTSTKKR